VWRIAEALLIKTTLEPDQAKCLAKLFELIGLKGLSRQSSLATYFVRDPEIEWRNARIHFREAPARRFWWEGALSYCPLPVDLPVAACRTLRTSLRSEI
jgi:hypothetical protein